MNKSVIVLMLASVVLSACGHSNGRAGHVKESAFPEVTKPYRSEQAIQNGDVVNLHGKYSNMEKWHRFLKNVEQNKEDKVRITQYTIEGDPIFYELVFDGKVIHYTYDNSMDAYGSDSGRPSTSCTGMGSKKAEQGQDFYALTGCDSDTGDTFWFAKE